ncbi:hypothetical protein RB599_005663 [Gaeumannomyces hyphopodioides]
MVVGIAPRSYLTEPGLAASPRRRHPGLFLWTLSKKQAQLLTLLTFGLWSKVGRLTHYAFDAVLFSAFLAGMKRSTGLTLKTDRIAGENKDLNGWLGKYLGVGEWLLDQSVAVAGSSGWFERTR